MLALTAPAWADETDPGFTAVRYAAVPGFTIGVRRSVVERLEIETTSEHRAGKRFAEGTAWYRLNKIFAIGLTANRDENVLGFGIGGRFYFGR
jgi:hypothetical protein